MGWWQDSYYVGRRRKRNWGPWLVVIVLLVALVGVVLYFTGGLDTITTLLYDQTGIVLAPELVQTPTPVGADVQALLDEGEKYYATGELKEAISVYRQAIRNDANNVEANLQLGRMLALTRRTQEAITYNQKAVDLLAQARREQGDSAELVRGSARALAYLGMAYDWNGEYGEAIRVCVLAIDTDPDVAEGYAFLAEAYADTFQLDKALDLAQQAVQLEPRSVEAQRNLGYVLEKRGDYESAIDKYKRAVALHPNLAYLHTSLGRNYRILGQYEEAIIEFQKAADLDVDDPEPHDLIGMVYYDQRNYQEAISQFERALEVDPNYASAYGHMGWCYYAQLDFEKAVPYFQKAIELDPPDLRKAEFMAELGWCYVHLKNCKEAKIHFNEALGIDKTLKLAWDGLAACQPQTPTPVVETTPTPG
ncbi:MAG: tetratricopeptide repeat protein [Chloroflexi bacterium]|nr:tetratricopeptide repeat protein [Chloroflexota bacterium]MBU1751745.1 tetratricopeptide repeat protein [Chloroflexota bacterium]MBU1879079.1 tetratricopeptide repeat protein [Chloroflexota bacterium]